MLKVIKALPEIQHMTINDLFHHTETPAKTTAMVIMIPTGIEIVLYAGKKLAKPRRNAILMQKPAARPHVNCPQNTTVVHNIPTNIDTAAVIKST